MTATEPQDGHCPQSEDSQHELAYTLGWWCRRCWADLHFGDGDQ